MQAYQTEKLVHVFAALSGAKENAVSHQGKSNWPLGRRKETGGCLRNVLPILDQLNLRIAKQQVEQFAGEMELLPIENVIATSDNIRSILEQELMQRKFFVLNVDHGKYYNNPSLAGDNFKDRFPKANVELIEAGNCFALDRYTACVCHLMRSLEYGLKALDADLKINWKPGEVDRQTWGQIIRKIESEKEMPDHKPKIVCSPAWEKKPEFYGSCLSVLSSIKSAYRDTTFHVALSYDEPSAHHIFEMTKGFLRQVAEELNEA